MHLQVQDECFPFCSGLHTWTEHLLYRDLEIETLTKYQYESSRHVKSDLQRGHILYSSLHLPPVRVRENGGVTDSSILVTKTVDWNDISVHHGYIQIMSLERTVMEKQGTIETHWFYKAGYFFILTER